MFVHFSSFSVVLKIGSSYRYFKFQKRCQTFSSQKHLPTIIVTFLFFPLFPSRCVPPSDPEPGASHRLHHCLDQSAVVCLLLAPPEMRNGEFMVCKPLACLLYTVIFLKLFNMHIFLFENVLSVYIQG
jgi:hypothetical protein